MSSATKTKKTTLMTPLTVKNAAFRRLEVARADERVLVEQERRHGRHAEPVEDTGREPDPDGREQGHGGRVEAPHR